MGTLSSFLHNVDTLAEVMPSKIDAASYIIRSKLDKTIPANGTYKGQNFSFRRDDITAVREVLEKKEYAPLAHIITSSSSPRVLDAGAHIGLLAMWVLGINANASVLSLEANAENYSWLKKNNDLAKNKYPNWSIVHGAGWKDDQGVSFINDGPTMSRRVGGSSEIKVPSVTLPALVERLAPDGRQIDLAKIDIEGSEEAFICTHPEALKRIDTLAIELHPKLCDTDLVEKTLREYFSNIKNVEDRLCSKPLLVCSRN